LPIDEHLIVQPLKGKRIVVTRARSQASSLVAALTELGAEVIELPTIETVPLESYDSLDNALKNIAQYQWLIVTSVNTARVLAERLTALKLPPSTLAPPRKVAIGSATAKAMREKGIEVDLIPDQYIAESLIAAMEEASLSLHSETRHSDDQREEESLRSPESNKALQSPATPSRHLATAIHGSRILLARATIARDIIPDELTRKGATVDVIDAYRTIIPEESLERMRQVFSDPSKLPNAVTFTSSSTVKNFFTLWNEVGFSGTPEGVAAISIGPITGETLRECGWQPATEATDHHLEGLIAALVDIF